MSGSESFAKYGDTVALVALSCLAAASVFICLRPSPTAADKWLVAGVAVAVATIVSVLIVRVRLWRRQSTVFLTPNQRQGVVVAMLFAGLIVLPVVAAIVGRPVPVPLPPLTDDEIEELTNVQVPSAATGALRPAVPHMADVKLLREEAAAIAATGGPGAAEARERVRIIDDHLREVKRAWEEQKGRKPGEPVPPGHKTLDQIPPPPIVPRNGNAGDGELKTFFGVLGGPFGQLLGDLLGLSGGGAYHAQVQVAVNAMAGGVAPSPAQLSTLLNTVQSTANDLQTKMEVLNELEGLGARMLNASELDELRKRIQDAKAELSSSVATAILEQLRKDPNTSRETLLGFLPDGKFATPEQKTQVKEVLTGNGFTSVWNKVFDGIRAR